MTATLSPCGGHCGGTATSWRGPGSARLLSVASTFAVKGVRIETLMSPREWTFIGGRQPHPAESSQEGDRHQRNALRTGATPSRRGDPHPPGKVISPASSVKKLAAIFRALLTGGPERNPPGKRGAMVRTGHS